MSKYYRIELNIGSLCNFKCKYCGRDSISPVCRECIAEGNEILHSKICEGLNNAYGIFGLFKFLLTIAWLISFIMVLCLKDDNLQNAMAQSWFCIASFGGTLLMSLLRNSFNKKINAAIDKEMKRRHKK